MSKFTDKYGNQGHAITLEDVTFHVRLPTAENLRFQMAVTAEVLQVGEDGQATRRDMSAADMVIAQIQAFVRTCILRVDGWDDYTPQALLAMPAACDDLWFAVSEKTRAEEAKAQAAEKKPLSTSDGPQSGAEKKSSTEGLRKAAG